MLRRIIDKLRRRGPHTFACLSEPPKTGPNDWTGPEIPLDSDDGPRIISKLLRDLLSEATKKQATTIKFSLLESEGDVTIEYQSDQGLEQTPHLPGYLWSGLVTSIPRFISIEACEGVLIDPATEIEWRFCFTKKADTIILTKLDSKEIQSVQE